MNQQQPEGSNLGKAIRLIEVVMQLQSENAALKTQLQELSDRLATVENWIDSEDSYRREQLERS